MERLDVALAARFNISRSFASHLIKDGNVSVAGIVQTSTSKKVSGSDQITLKEGALKKEELTSDIIPQDIPLNVIYEDENVLVLNKDPGISVHTSISEKTGTLLNALVFRNAFGDGHEMGILRPGIVHRIDKDTSWVLIVAKNRATQEVLADQFKNRSLNKEYIALVEGIIDKDLVIEKGIARNKKDRKKMGIYENGRDAVTYVYPQKYFFKDKNKKYTLLRIVPKTGRTHQIRIHLKSIGHAIVGDKIYNGEKNDHMLLHARSLEIDIPVGRKKFVAPVPEYFDEYIASLNIYVPEKKDKKSI